MPKSRSVMLLMLSLTFPGVAWADEAKTQKLAKIFDEVCLGSAPSMSNMEAKVLQVAARNYGGKSKNLSGIITAGSTSSDHVSFIPAKFSKQKISTCGVSLPTSDKQLTANVWAQTVAKRSSQLGLKQVQPSKKSHVAECTGRSGIRVRIVQAKGRTMFMALNWK